MPESTFERAFSDLAHASLRDKAPGLTDYLVGFQMIDKNDEDTHAVGVFGFKTGDQWLYAPVFFLNGSLKGTDLLYVKSQDLFVPLQDNWVNYLLSRQPYILGAPEPKSENELGIIGPDFRVFSESPSNGGTKWASVIPTKSIQPWARPFMPVYIDMIENGSSKHASVKDKLDLSNVVKEHPEVLETLLGTMKENVKFAEAVMQFYDVKDLTPNLSEMHKSAEEYGIGDSQTSNAFEPKMVCPSCNFVLDVPPDSDIKKCPNCGVALPDGAAVVEVKEAVRLDPYTQSGKDPMDIINSLGTFPKGRRHLNNGFDGLSKLAGVADEPRLPVEPVVIEGFTNEDPPSILADGPEPQLTTSEKEKLRSGEIVIRDHRTNTSKVYNAEFERKLANPTETGVYEVLDCTGKFKQCLVICNPKTIGRGRTAGVCVLVTEDKEYGLFRNIDIYTRSMEDALDSLSKRSMEWYDKASELSSMKTGNMYVAFDEAGVGTIPFKFLMSTSSNDGTTDYRVCQKTELRCVGLSIMKTDNSYLNDKRHVQVDNTPDYGATPNEDMSWEEEKARGYSDYELSESRGILESDREGISKFHVLGGSSLVPKGLCRVIDLGPVRRGTGKGKGYDKTVKIFSPGTIADAESYILKLGAEVMDVRASGPEIIIDSDKGQKVLRKNAALKHLVLDWGLGETDARDLVKYASRKTDRYYVKRAQPESELIRTAPGGPSINIDSNSSPADGTPPGVPVQNEDTRFEQVPGMVPDAGNRDAYKLLDDPEVQQALAAAEKGQKEVFDTSVVGGLVKAVDVNSLVNDMIPDIIKGMDRVGRILFMFYWHNEQFRDRYGRQDMMDLEDSLRNMFSGVGDLALFMKQKTIEPNPGTDAIDINLEKPAG